MAKKSQNNKQNNTKKNNNDKDYRNEIKDGEQLPLEEQPASKGIWHQLIPFFLAALAILLTVCFLFTEECGIFGEFVTSVLYGMFSWIAWFIPLMLIYIAIFWKKDVDMKNLKTKLTVIMMIAVVLSAGVFYISVMSNGGVVPSMSILNIWKEAQYENGFKFGGILGSYTGFIIFKIFSKVGTPIVLVFTLLILGIFLFNVQPDVLWNKVQNAVISLVKKLIRSIKNAFGNSNKNTAKKKLYLNKPSVESDCEPDGEVFDDEEYLIDEPSDPFVHDAVPDAKNRKKQKSHALKAMNAVSAVYGVDEQDEPFDVEEKPVKLQKRDIGFDYDGDVDGDEMPFDEVDSLNDHVEGDVEISKEKKIRKKQIHDMVIADADKETFDYDEGCDEVKIENYIDKDTTKATIYGSDDPNDVELEEPDELTIQRVSLMTSVDAGDEIPEEQLKYTFPPIEFLQSKPEISNDEDFERECRATGEKLVEALKSFKVNTKLVNISRGPTVTRYELAPDEGVRVKSIANLSDDIALNLAAKGAVRIEAPIVGKAAVGVEIANTVRETVYLRELLENPAFTNAKSSLTTAVGLDVAGDPTYMDIAKMPHLLIAGTTGAGKSVCINCIVLSLLYKASPDEVKLIMIDPKKVEFSIYNGLPHLIVPVVSNAKKSAGALVWAVNEMERRYDLIEEAGVRDIAGYNEATKDDPEKEFMPKLVIVIDELADLMMTAPDSVETSICRIAQKGRAAGMHLIIGTQRPSVDVITGLIKANVPSRIAFTVSSQIDSRTIIDIGGAEKLIGRGDMLYSPIGALKPTRLQGAFVSDAEVERITSFIRENNAETSYDDTIMANIESEAERCSTKSGKSKGGASSSSSSSSNIDDAAGDGDENAFSDPKFNEAVKIAIESGKISTSYLQRRLSLGYGRAAKLIDAMEKLGIVSAPDGQRARNVLISQQEWSEMMMRRTDDEE